MKVLACSLVLLVALVTASCGSGSSSQNSSTAQIRIMQGASDLGNVDVQINGNSVANNLGWRQTFPTKTTTYTGVQAGSVHYQEFATGTTSPALVDTHLSVSPNTFYTVITAGEESSGLLGTILLTDDHVAPASGQLRLRFVNAASAVGPIDLYLPAAGNGGLPTSPSVPALGFKSATSYFTFSGTSVQLCANPAGVPPTLGGLPGAGPFCMISITLNVKSPPQNSMTFLFLDPVIPPNAPPGSFTAPVVLAGIPF
jgi:hypothetical protein